MLRNVFFGSILSGFVILAGLIFVLPTDEANSTSDVSATEGANAAINTDAKFEAGDIADFDENSFVINNIDIFDGENIQTAVAIFIKNGRVERLGSNVNVPDKIRVIDGAGKMLLPGLIDAHTHSFGTALNDALRFGVTTHLDMFSAPQLLPEAKRSRENLAQTDRADMFSAGMLATAPGGHGTQFGVPVETLSAKSKTAIEAEVERWIEARIAEGSDYIKLVYTPYSNYLPSIDRLIAQTVIKVGHARGLRVVAHISTQKAARDLVEDNIDGLVHIFADEIIDDDLASLMATKNIFVIPTLAVLASVSGQNQNISLLEDERVTPYLVPAQKQILSQTFSENGLPGYDFNIAIENIRKLHERGVKILAGSDAANPGVTYGVSIHQEIALLQKAGLSPIESLRAATSVPAKIFDLGARGRLTKGARADFVILSAWDVNDDFATLSIGEVYKNGYRIDRELAQTEINKITNADFGTFDTDLSSPFGNSWAVTTDSFAGGKSTATTKHIKPGRDGRGGAMRVTANVNPGFFFPWAGAVLAASVDFSKAYSLEDFSKLSFDVRGTPGAYQVFMFTVGAPGVPPTHNFQVTQEWQTVSLNFSDFSNGFDPKLFAALSIAAGPGTGEFIFDIDNVRVEK